MAPCHAKGRGIELGPARSLLKRGFMWLRTLRASHMRMTTRSARTYNSMSWRFVYPDGVWLDVEIFSGATPGDVRLQLSELFTSCFCPVSCRTSPKYDFLPWKKNSARGVFSTLLFLLHVFFGSSRFLMAIFYYYVLSQGFFSWSSE